MRTATPNWCAVLKCEIIVCLLMFTFQFEVRDRANLNQLLFSKTRFCWPDIAYLLSVVQALPITII